MMRRRALAKGSGACTAICWLICSVGGQHGSGEIGGVQHDLPVIKRARPNDGESTIKSDGGSSVDSVVLKNLVGDRLETWTAAGKRARRVTLGTWLGEDEGGTLGAALGEVLGASLEEALGPALGKELCLALGDALGPLLSVELGAPLGDELGLLLGGVALGLTLGDVLGPALGDELGPALGEELGVALGPALGEALGPALGEALSAELGIRLGENDGDTLGCSVGTSAIAIGTFTDPRLSSPALLRSIAY
jgi:hypothetical protein